MEIDYVYSEYLSPYMNYFRGGIQVYIDCQCEMIHSIFFISTLASKLRSWSCGSALALSRKP